MAEEKRNWWNPFKKTPSKKRQEKKRKYNLAHGVCDPVYKQLLQDIIDEHRKASQDLADGTQRDEDGQMIQTALVLCQTSDEDRGQIEQLLESRKIAPEMFEIDRIRDEQQIEYMSCINEVRKHPPLLTPSVDLWDKEPSADLHWRQAVLRVSATSFSCIVLGSPN